MVNERLTGKNQKSQFGINEHGFSISAVSGEGFDDLLSALSRYAESYLAGAEQALISRERHRHALTDAEKALGRALGDDLVGKDDLIAGSCAWPPGRSAG